jgi:hypothetical protein
MSLSRRVALATLAFLLAIFSASCGLLVKSRAIVRHGKPVTQGQTLITATRDELNERITNIYNPVQSFQATVDMTPSVGSVYAGQITEIKDVRAFVLYRKANDIRIIGQTPLVRTRAFDMVSTGNRFSLYVSTKNLFVEGENNAPTTSKNKLENLRPEAFLSSMLIRPATNEETPVLYDQTDEENATYVLMFLKRDAGGQLTASRSVWFDRLDLSIIRQVVYDPRSAAIVSDTRYAKWQHFEKVLFPSHIDINRPADGYGVAMDLMQMQMNKAMTDDQFVLARPEGSQLQVIGAAVPPAAAGTSK